MRKKYGTAGQATDDNITRHMHFACWITKATDTRSEYVILLAVARQQWLRERASMLCLYVLCLSSLRTDTGHSYHDIPRVLWTPQAAWSLQTDTILVASCLYCRYIYKTRTTTLLFSYHCFQRTWFIRRLMELSPTFSTREPRKRNVGIAFRNICCVWVTRWMWLLRHSSNK
jgi:hypothetical protein